MEMRRIILEELDKLRKERLIDTLNKKYGGRYIESLSGQFREMYYFSMFGDFVIIHVGEYKQFEEVPREERSNAIYIIDFKTEMRDYFGIEDWGYSQF
jgi:hypothetical protein